MRVLLEYSIGYSSDTLSDVTRRTTTRDTAPRRRGIDAALRGCGERAAMRWRTGAVGPLEYSRRYEASKVSFQRIGARNGGGVAGENVANM